MSIRGCAMAISDTGSRQSTAEVWQPRRGLFSGIAPTSRFYWLRMLAENRVALVSLGFLVVVVILALLAPVIAPHDPYMVDPINRLMGPGAGHWFGTDDVGRDVLSRMLYG